jgi:outer membrane protein OmpA-like peptidoglycan-associated protein
VLERLIFATAVLICHLGLAAPPQPETKIAGSITLRDGEVMNVKTAAGKVIAVILNPDTKLEEPQGAFGFRKKRLNVTALAPGLNVAVQGLLYENNQLVAKTVTISRQSLQSGASAGPPLDVTRNSGVNLSDYEVKATYDAHFASGSALLSETDKAALLQMTNGVTALPHYMIEVQGFADVPGSNAYDRQLSRDRGEAVIDYLEQSAHVPVTHIIAPGALAVAAPASENETAQGSPQHRRAELKILVPTGAAGR